METTTTIVICILGTPLLGLLSYFAIRNMQLSKRNKQLTLQQFQMNHEFGRIKAQYSTLEKCLKEKDRFIERVFERWNRTASNEMLDSKKARAMFGLGSRPGVPVQPRASDNRMKPPIERSKPTALVPTQQIATSYNMPIVVRSSTAPK